MAVFLGVFLSLPFFISCLFLVHPLFMSGQQTDTLRRQQTNFMMLNSKRWITAAAVLMAAGIGVSIVACSDNGGSTSQNASLVSGKVKHVWVITLENENYSTTFGLNTQSPYLAKTLTCTGCAT